MLKKPKTLCGLIGLRSLSFSIIYILLFLQQTTKENPNSSWLIQYCAREDGQKKKRLKAQKKPSKLQSRWQVSNPRWGSTAQYIHRLTLHCLCPRPPPHPTPLLPELCLPLAALPAQLPAQAGSQPTLRTSPLPPRSPLGIPQPTRAIQPSPGAAACPLASPSTQSTEPQLELFGRPCKKLHISPAHTTLAPQTHPSPVQSGTTPMAQSSCFHLLQSLNQDCYPEPTQMPMCLLTWVPSHWVSHCPITSATHIHAFLLLIRTQIS